MIGTENIQSSDRLLVGVLGNRNSGKSHTWNLLFNRTVRRGRHPRELLLLPKECVEVFLVSGSFEERGEYAGEILENQNSRIVLCSMQYTEEVKTTLDYFVSNDFFLYIQWLNPGFGDSYIGTDQLNIVEEILSFPSLVSIRDAQIDATTRVQEIREYIYGWAKYRNLIISC